MAISIIIIVNTVWWSFNVCLHSWTESISISNRQKGANGNMCWYCEKVFLFFLIKQQKETDIKHSNNLNTILHQNVQSTIKKKNTTEPAINMRKCDHSLLLTWRYDCLSVVTAPGEREGDFGERSEFQNRPGSAVWQPPGGRPGEQQTAPGTVCLSVCVCFRFL